MTNSLTELAALNRIADAIEQLVAKSGSSSSSGGGGDCGCMSDLTCILAPLVASQIQANKAIISLAKKDSQWTENDEGNAWPDPRDTDPPIDFTPPIDGTIPVGSVYPPGGLGGMSDSVAYGVYRCDFAWYMVDYLIAYWESVLEIYSAAEDVISWASTLDDINNFYNFIKGRLAKEVVKESITGTAVILTKETTKFGLKSFVKLFLLALEVVEKSFQLITTGIQMHIAYLKTRRKAMVCALLKGENAAEAVDNLNTAAAKLWTSPIGGSWTIYPWKWQNNVILGDLAKNLFACEAGYDFSVLNGYATEFGEGCDECDFNCEGATVFIDFDNGKQGWVNVAPPTQLPPPAPKIIDFGEAVGNGQYCPPNHADCAAYTQADIHTGKMCWKQGGSVQIASNLVRSFSQVCVIFGGYGSTTNKIDIYVNGVLAMSKGAMLPMTDGKVTKFYDTVLLHIENENDKVSSYPNEKLKDSKFYGAVRVVRHASGASSNGEARIFGIAFG
jgi:hypothetical protein